MADRQDVRLRTFLPVTAILLVGGLLVDLGLNQPATAEVKRLETYQAQLQGRLIQIGEQHHSDRDLAKALQLGELSDLSAEARQEDPIAYIGGLLNAAGLMRLELTTLGAVDEGGLRTHRFAVRVLGDFNEMLAFVRGLELGSHLAAIDAFSIETTDTRQQLEGRFNLSVYSLSIRRQP